ncbi:MAG: hypothetical protein JRG74_15810 [Deltaproteobacteria bacterium]|nr:hypothetical protein [Deltaproteobacteria bacterium]
MGPKQTTLRCYAEKKDDIWQAFCIDLNLAVQGETQDEVRAKLHQQIVSYLHDALEGDDKKYAAQLLNRKAPIGFRVKYTLYRIYRTLRNFYKAKDGINHIFNEIIPPNPHEA